MTTKNFKRKLTAILSADAVGYSRLMGDDEADTVKTLESYKAVMFSLIRQHRGRVVDSPGDNLLAEFGSVVDAVQCALSIQKELQARNTDLPENRKMEFRIGINLGDVIEEQDRIYGDGVNIAARLEALADPGGICVSKTAFDYIENKLPFGYSFIGEQTVKNIAKPIGAYKVLMETRVVDAKATRKTKPIPFRRKKSALSIGIIAILAIATGLYWNLYLRGASVKIAPFKPDQEPIVFEVKDAPKTIAVLPFDDFSPNGDQKYFVDGLTEEILTSLEQISSLNVIARASSFSFRNTNKTIPEIAETLGVDHILQGSIRKAGDKLRIKANLIKAVDSSNLWSKTYDKNFSIKDTMAIQEDIASSIADTLKLTLEAFQLLGGTDNIKAYEKYLVAKGQATNIDYEKAMQSIQDAIALDPGFALAWAYKGSVHLFHAAGVPMDRANVERNSAEKSALNAIELDHSLGQAHLILGTVFSGRGEFIEAEKSFRNGMALKINFSDYYEYGLTLHYSTVGYLKKTHEIYEKILQNDPLQPVLRIFHMLTLGSEGDMLNAEEQYSHIKTILGNSGIDTGLADADAIILFLRLSKNKEISKNDIPQGELTNLISELMSSPKEERLQVFQSSFFGDKNIGVVRNAIGTCFIAYFIGPESAMEAIEKANYLNSSIIQFVWSPVMKEVRQSRRFKEFVREIGLVDYWKQYGWPDLCHPVGDDDFVCE